MQVENREEGFGFYFYLTVNEFFSIIVSGLDEKVLPVIGP